MKNLIIDIEKHYPIGYKIFGPCDYYSPSIPPNRLIPLQLIPDAYTTEKTYNIPILTKKEQLEKQYKYIFIVFPINSINDIGYVTPSLTIEIQEVFTQLYKIIINDIDFEKIIFLDDNDKYETAKGVAWMNESNLRVDYIFKREYKLDFKQTYNDTIFPAPWLMFGNPNPVWLLFENRIKGTGVVNSCFWAGAGYRSVLQEIHQHLSIRQNLNINEYLNMFNKYRFFLHLNGNGDICKRLYEGLSRDSLMLMQYTNVVFPFENNDFFAEECIFQTGDEFIKKYETLKNNNTLYEKCKNKQEEIIQKYLNPEWIQKYTYSKIL